MGSPLGPPAERCGRGRHPEEIMTNIRSRASAWLVAGLLIAGLAGGASAQSDPGAANALAGTDWMVSTIGGAPVASGIGATLLFGDTDAGGFAGCNRYVAPYGTDGVSSLTFGAVASTMMSCEEPASTFEQTYLAALATVASYTLDADGLALADASGTTVLTFGAAVPASVEGPWVVTLVNNGNQGVEPVPDGVSATVAFGPDGTVEGFGGCNSFGGGYSVDGESIAIGPLMSTKMSCGKTADTFEAQLLAALKAATTWSVSAGVLDLRDDSGAQQVGARSAIG
jgi:heat shock protein HslJ